MSKADRALKVSRGNTNSSQITEEENGSMLPRIDTKKSLNNLPDSYNFISTKKSSASALKESLPSILSKDLLGGLSHQERALVEELTRKIEDQRKEIDQRNQNLMAIQRNFEGLSAMLKKEKELGVDNKKKVGVLAEENTKLTEENRLLGRRIDDMIERLNKYEHELDHNAKDKKKIHQTIEEQELLKNKIQDLQNQLEKKKKEVIDLETKNRSMLTQVDKFKKVALGLEEEKQKSLLQFKEARNELIISQTENDRLHKIIVEYKVRVADFDKLKEEYQTLLARKNEIEKESKEYLREVSELRSEINTLRAQNKKLEESTQSQAFQLKFGNTKEETFREEIKELKNKLEIKEEELLECKDKINNLQRIIKEEDQYYSNYKWLIDKCETLKKEGFEVALVKKPELDKLNSELNQIKEKTKDYDEIKRKLEKLTKDMEQKNEMIDRCISDKQFEIEKNNKLNEKIRILEEENKKYSTHNQKLMGALDFKNENERLKDGKFNAEIEYLKMKLDANISSFGDINMKHKNLANERDTMHREVETLQKQVADQTKEIESLKDKIKSLEADSDAKDRESGTTSAQLKALKEENAKVVSALNKQIEELKASIVRKDEEISQLKAALDGLSQGSKSSQQSMQSLQKEIKDLKNSIEIQENQIEALRKLNNTLTAEVTAKTQEAQEMVQRVKENQDKVKALSDQNENLVNRNNEMSLTLKQSSDNLATANQTIKQLQSSIESLESKYNEAMKKLSEIDETAYKAKLAEVEDREKQFYKVIAKMDHAQTSLLISLSCCECMNYLKNPVTLLPCGHNYCEKCVPKGSVCKECGGNKEVEYSYKNKLLEDVIAKVSYNQVILESLKPPTNR